MTDGTRGEIAAGAAGLPVRNTARIILADGLDRILLFRFVFVGPDTRPPDDIWWGTPGGGVDEGESLPQAAARELFEETGLRVQQDRFDRIVARNRGVARFNGAELWFENHYYFLRAQAERFELDASGWQEIERASIAEHRWWSAADLAATAAVIHPPGLARILPDLLAGRLPEQPLDVGWA
ncbi:MAG TPA: NUDIX domain-containing protein [Actinocrinis sp.]|nr:NUDIX domain-containing protein [Actinocrinis sp.]